jgi:hypothetical protein
MHRPKEISSSAYIILEDSPGGYDISPIACRVMAKRLRDVCALPESSCSGAPDAAPSSALDW